MESRLFWIDLHKNVPTLTWLKMYKFIKTIPGWVLVYKSKIYKKSRAMDRRGISQEERTKRFHRAMDRMGISQKERKMWG